MSSASRSLVPPKRTWSDGLTREKFWQEIDKVLDSKDFRDRQMTTDAIQKGWQHDPTFRDGLLVRIQQRAEEAETLKGAREWSRTHCVDKYGVYREKTEAEKRATR